MASEESTQIVRSLSQRLATASFWMQLTAVMMIIYGVLTAITIVGLIIAWLPIWMGVLLFQAASAVNQAQTDGDQEALGRCMDKLKIYFIIIGVFTLIGLVLTGAGFLMGGIGAMSGVGGGGL